MDTEYSSISRTDKKGEFYRYMSRKTVRKYSRKKSEIKPDTILKDFWRDNGRFAALINAVLFQEETVITPENLTEMDTDMSTVITLNGYAETVQRILDLVKKSAYGVDFVVLCLENQMGIHYAMPLRIMTGDTLGYLKECAELVKKNKAEGHWANGAELLSGLKKGDRLHPMITICVYYGEEKWDGPLSLTDMLEVPERLRKVVNDYKMNLVQVRDSGELHFQNEDVAALFDLCRKIRQKDYAGIQKNYEGRMLSPDVGLAVGAITGARTFINDALKQKGEKAHMWKAVMEHEEEVREEGRKEVREEARRKAEEARKKGIMTVISSYHELGATQQAAAKKLVSGFGIPPELAWRNVRQYWGK